MRDRTHKQVNGIFHYMYNSYFLKQKKNLIKSLRIRKGGWNIFLFLKEGSSVFFGINPRLYLLRVVCLTVDIWLTAREDVERTIRKYLTYSNWILTKMKVCPVLFQERVHYHAWLACFKLLYNDTNINIELSNHLSLWQQTLFTIFDFLNSLRERFQ